MKNLRSLSTSGRRVAAVAAVFTLAGCGHRAVDQNAKAKIAIQAAYDRQSAAYVSHQPDAVMAECSPDYTEVNGNESDSRQHVSDTITGFIAFAQKLDASATVRNVNVDGNTANVVVDRHFDMVTFPLKRKNDPKAVQHHYVADETNNDVWVDTPGKGWLKLRSVTVTSNTSFDGRSNTRK